MERKKDRFNRNLNDVPKFKSLSGIETEQNV